MSRGREPAAAVGAALAACVLALGAPADAAARAHAGVTIRASVYVNINKVRTVVLSGAVASAAAGERVDVLARECGYSGFRVVAGTQTAPGGAWLTEMGVLASGTAYRARWRNRLSRTIVPFRRPVTFAVEKLRGRRSWRVTVSTYGSPVSFARRVVELQRRAGGRWVRVRRARLRWPKADTFTATFAVRARGLTLRVLVPRRTAAPCFLPAVSRMFRS